MQRIVLSNLFGPGANLHDLSWKPFREGVEIHRIYGDGINGPSAALLRYAAGAVVPRHRHEGFEHIVVLESEQADENDTVPAGTLVVNPPGTSHEVVSPKGCVVLVMWEKPVVFADQRR